MGIRTRIPHRTEKNECIIDIWVFFFITYAFLGSLYILTSVEVNPTFVQKMSYLILIGLSGMFLGLFMSPAVGGVKFVLVEKGLLGERGIGKEEFVLFGILFIGLFIQFFVLFYLRISLFASIYSEKIQKIIFYTSASVYEEFLFTFWFYRLVSFMEKSISPFKFPIGSILTTGLIFALFHSYVYGGMIQALLIVFILRILFQTGYELTNRLSIPIILHFIQNFSIP